MRGVIILEIETVFREKERDLKESKTTTGFLQQHSVCQVQNCQ